MKAWLPALRRTVRGVRGSLGSHAIALLGLVAAFTCLAVVLLGLLNLQRVNLHWRSHQRVTVYLTHTNAEVIAGLQLILENLQEVVAVHYVSPTQAHDTFVAETERSDVLRTLPVSAFPASLEVDLQEHVSQADIQHLGERIARLQSVQNLETYQSFFSPLQRLLDAAWSATALLTLLVGLCTAAVINSTTQLSVHRRRMEIQVLELCGATQALVRLPFVLEGALQALLCALLAQLLLAPLWWTASGWALPEQLQPWLGVRPVLFEGLLATAEVLFATSAGALGSLLALRQHVGGA